MRIANWKIASKLGAGFGVLLVLMVLTASIGISRLGAVGELSAKVIEVDWAKADAAATITATTRANAALTMQLFVVQGQPARNELYQQIDVNKKTIGAALDVLDKLIYAPEGRQILNDLKPRRVAYVASFTKVAKLMDAEQREQASALLQSETLPALARLQETVKALSDVQKALVRQSGTDVLDHISTARQLMIGLAVVALLAGAAAAWAVSRAITLPMQRALAVAQSVAAGDLRSKIDDTHEDETGQLLQALRTMNDKLAAIVGEVRAASDTISAAAGEIATGNLDLSSRTEQQASSLEETAASMEQLASSVKNNAEHARAASGSSSQAADVAARGGAVVQQVVQTMSSIEGASSKIVDIIGVIDGIAFQTNILALNAAVEAARAGEQGRGFAVVASEVRTLAQRSATAAKEIKALIGASAQEVATGTRLVEQAGSTMDDVVSSVQQVAALVGEIASANAEQSGGIDQINQAVTDMDRTTQENAALVEQAAAAAGAMHEQTRRLTALVGHFQIDQRGAEFGGAQKGRKQISYAGS